ncbi:ricin B lectin domain-containing protein [Mycena haematopus]|nr:ricin B lectin domain-containing protein [Mycena haematopus]
MISSTVFAVVCLALSVTAVQIQSTNSAFFNAGIQGCIAVANNTDGEPLIIHNCNTEPLPNQDWQVIFWYPQEEEGSAENAGPEQITVFGDKCIDVPNGVNENGVKLQIWTCAAGNTNQQWISVTDSTFQWNGTDKCIDLTDGSITDENVLQLWTCDSANTNQKWIGAPNPDTDDVAYLMGGNISAGAGPYCIAAASDTDGAEVALVACFNSEFPALFPNGNITWSVPVQPLKGPIKTFNNKCLDVPNASTANGVKLQIWTCIEGNTNQLFSLPNLFQIEWNGEGKCLDLTNGNSTSGNPIQMWDCAS